MLQKTRIAALIENWWYCMDRLMAIGAVKKQPPIEKHQEQLKNLDGKDEKKLREVEGHFRVVLRKLMYQAPKLNGTTKAVEKPATGIIQKIVEKLGAGDVQASGENATGVQFKVGLAGTKQLDDHLAALRAENQLPEILDCLDISGMTPALKTDQLVLTYPTLYNGHDWCGSAEAMLTGLEVAAARAARLASIFAWMKTKLNKDETAQIEMHHIWLVFTECKFEQDRLVQAKFSTVETPMGAQQREIKARFEEALRIRTKKVLGLEVRPNQIEYKLENEPPLIVDLDVITGW